LYFYLSTHAQYFGQHWKNALVTVAQPGQKYHSSCHGFKYYLE